jgi:hypothetical protein
MTITSYQVQNILRTYAKQLSRGQRLARARAASEPTPADQVNISIEARRKQVIEKITAEIVSNIGFRLPGLGPGLADLEGVALTQLSKEYGQSLDISQDEVTGQLRFKVVDPEKGEVVQDLGAEESARLQDRLYVITQEIIDQNMV